MRGGGVVRWVHFVSRRWSQGVYKMVSLGIFVYHADKCCLEVWNTSTIALLLSRSEADGHWSQPVH